MTIFQLAANLVDKTLRCSSTSASCSSAAVDRTCGKKSLLLFLFEVEGWEWRGK